MKHYSLEEILQYLRDELPELELITMERHFGECADCAARARRAFAVTDGWTAHAHAEAVRAEAKESDPLVEALLRARTLYAEFAERLGKWLSGTEALWRGHGLKPAVAGSGIQYTKGAPAAILKVSLQAGSRRARITVRGRPRSLLVTLPAPESPVRAPVALLFSSDESFGPLLSPFVPVGSRSIHMAEFDTVPAGEYMLAVEPVE